MLWRGWVRSERRKRMEEEEGGGGELTGREEGEGEDEEECGEKRSHGDELW